MGFRFYKRVKIAPGISLNFSKSGPSVSLGPRGLKHTIGPHGSRTTFGIPGTGLYYTTTTSKNKRNDYNPINPPSQTKPSFFQQLFYSPEEKSFVKGMELFTLGKNNDAYNAFERSSLIDGYFMCGFILLGENDYAGAERFFNKCKENVYKLGSMLKKIGGDFELLLDITEYIEAPIQVDKRGLTLSLVEAYQHQNKYSQSLTILTEAWNENPSDKLVCLSLIDLICMSEASSKDEIKEIVEIASAIENDEPIDTNILYLRSYGLYRLNLVDAAIEQLTGILKRTKNRPEILMLDIRYLRGQMYEEIGQLAKAKKDYESIYSKMPSYEDVAEKLNL